MRISENQLRETLSREVQVSDQANERLRDTYEILEKRQEDSGKKKYYGRNLRAAAAAAAVLLWPQFRAFRH